MFSLPEFRIWDFETNKNEDHFQININNIETEFVERCVCVFLGDVQTSVWERGSSSLAAHGGADVRMV